jgi:GNAT superfamily N-acetyltransferase
MGGTHLRQALVRHVPEVERLAKGHTDHVVATEIRPAEPADVPSLRAVFRRSSLSNDGDRTILLAHPEVLELSDLRLRDGNPIVATVDGTVAGFANIIDSDGWIELDGLFVDPDWMRRGVGRVLVEAVIADACARGFARIEVTANEHARSFYEAVGFVQHAVVETRFMPAPRMHLDVEPSPPDQGTSADRSSDSS